MTAAPTRTDADTSRLRLGSAVMALGGVGFIGYGLLFFVRNFTDSFLEMGITENEVSVGKAEITEFSPSLFHYISHLHIAVAGLLIATGLAVAALSWYGVRRGEWWAFATAVATPVVALAIALPAHYPNNFDTGGHLGLIYADVALFLVGVVLAYRAFPADRRAL